MQLRAFLLKGSHQSLPLAIQSVLIGSHVGYISFKAGHCLMCATQVETFGQLIELRTVCIVYLVFVAERYMSDRAPFCL